MVDFNPVQYNKAENGRRLLDYLPPVVRQVLDFQQISAATEPEIRLAWQAVERVLGRRFLAEADGPWRLGAGAGAFPQGRGEPGGAPGSDFGGLAAQTALHIALAARLAGRLGRAGGTQ